MQRRRRAVLGAFLASGAAAIILAVNLVLFVPYTIGSYDLSVYRGSEYYELMDTIGKMTYTPEKTNNFEQWSLRKEGFMTGTPEDNVSQGTELPSHSAQSYEEVTQNQTKGVIEGDLFKRSSDYVYYLSFLPGRWITEDNGGVKKEEWISRRYLLRVYSIKNGEYRFVSELIIAPQKDYDLVFSEKDGLFLSEDCKTVTLVMLEHKFHRTEEDNSPNLTSIVNIDVSDPASPREIGRASVSGTISDSRLIKNTLLIFTQFWIGNDPDFAKPEEYLPQFGTSGDMQTLSMEDIYLPDNAGEASYLFVCTLDVSTLAFKDASALFSYSSFLYPKLYVSENNIFATREITKQSETSIPEGNAHFVYKYSYTEIYKIGYNEGGELSPEGAFEVHGIIKNQYSLDEYQNVLRVVTTSRDFCSSSSYSYPTEERVPDELQKALDRNKDLERPKCNLYCVDLDDFSVIASIEDFSDPEESVKSVRFSGDKLYVCTATGDYDWNGGGMVCIPVDDPVFEFDLSDLDNITWTDTGTIPGYSLSLIEFTDGTLLGIGYGDDRDTLKIELYRKEGEAVKSVAKYELNHCSFSADFKAYFIDAEHGLVGLGVRRYDDQTDNEYEYLLLRFDGTKFSEAGYQFELAGGSDNYTGNLDRMRACYIDKFLFLLCDSRANIIYIG